jgi:glycosyltransferase involved in cell wall biosynthesis
MRREPEALASVAILWNGLPRYAAAAIAAAAKQNDRRIVVIATRPEVPAAGAEQAVGVPVHWIDRNSRYSFRDLGLCVPGIVFTAGWSVPSFMRLAREVKRMGGKAVCMCDNSFRGDLRQRCGAAVYRLAYRRLFDYAWVPGRSANRLMRFYGLSDTDVSQGLYTADTTLFRCNIPLSFRPLRFVFVGQFIDRKNVLSLCDAFLLHQQSSPVPCDLHLYGAGPLRDRLPRHASIVVHPFAPPETLAAALNEARCLVLPSRIDHWGVVVHEAASCGMLLIVSETTGAADDLCGPHNACRIRSSSEPDMVRAFRWASSLTAADLAVASQESVERAAYFSIDAWAETFNRICVKLASS